jgi:predicted nucleotidyltransferase
MRLRRVFDRLSLAVGGTAAKTPVRRQAAEMALSMPICYPSAMVEAKRPNLAGDAVVVRFRAALRALYGDRLERAVLFGSRARGDARPDSDYDVAIFLRDYTRAWPEIQPLGKITTDILQDTGAVISALPFPAGSFRDRTMLMAEIRSEGIDL